MSDTIETDTVAATFTREPVTRLSRDLRAAAKLLSDEEARFYVDRYYSIQGDRIAVGNQISALERDAKAEGRAPEPHSIMHYLYDNYSTLEQQVKAALDGYSSTHPVGRWLRANKGIGPVLAAALLAHLRIEGAPTVGSWWRYAGMDPTRSWLGNEKAEKMVKEVVTGDVTDEVLDALAARVSTRPDVFRQGVQKIAGEGATITRSVLVRVLARRPWNAELKKTGFLIGESFVKVSGSDNAFYARLYKLRKAYETKKNESGGYRDQVEARLRDRAPGKDTDARAALEKGRLPLAQIHARAKRYAVKMLISGMHTAWYWLEHSRLPEVPWAIGPGGAMAAARGAMGRHTHVIAPAHADVVPGLAAVCRAAGYLEGEAALRHVAEYWGVTEAL